MDKPTLRLLIQEKLMDGRLPQERLPRMWGGPGGGETCDACGERVTRAQMGMEILDATGAGLQLHIACFLVWEVERQCVTRAAEQLMVGGGRIELPTPAV
jgi:hypothetical protein